jgi:hypothetical protein
MAVMASIGAGTGVLGSEAGYSFASGKNFESSKLVTTSIVGGVTGAINGVLGAPAGINPISNQVVAFGARTLVNGVSGALDYSASEMIDGRKPTTYGLGVSAGVGLVSGLAGEALPGYHSQTLETYGSQVFKRSSIAAFDQFNGTLRNFARKELALQGVDDALRSGGVSTFQNYLGDYLTPR